jgi:virulence-associated protein VapD
MLYNHFAFSKALENLKTMDLSYDFLSECGAEYDEIQALVKEIRFENEEQSLAFLLEYIKDSQAKYTASELYLLNRLHNHVASLADIYAGSLNVDHVDFQNPLYR